MAMTSSPMNFSIRPECFLITGTRRAKQALIRSRTASGSICSDMAVKPEISANKTVTSFRSPNMDEPPRLSIVSFVSLGFI